MMIREVQVKYKRHKIPPETLHFSKSSDVYEAMKDIFLEQVEVFRVIMLNSKNKMVAFEDASRGSLSTSVVHPRDVLWSAVHHRAAAIIICHNHPSGDPAPSNEDRACTIRIYIACRILGIKFLDHIIIGDSDYFSFADGDHLREAYDAWKSVSGGIGLGEIP